MAAELIQEYTNMISALSESHFNSLVVEFNKEYWDTNEVFITNGSYDGGIDLVVRTGGDEMKKSIQVTVQKTGIEKKILDDAKKAKENQSKFGYLPELELYISQAVSKSVQNRLVRDAKLTYGISLKIIDSKELAQAADDYSSIAKVLRSIYMSTVSSEQIQVDKQEKMLYDILALGSDTTKVKHHFIHSSMLYFMYEFGECTDENLCYNVNRKLGVNYNNSFYRNQLFSLRDSGSIVVSDDKKSFSLSSNAKKTLEQASSLVVIQEQSLFQDVEKVLSKFGMKDSATELVGKVLSLFEENYSVDLREEEFIGAEQVNENIRGLYKDMVRFIKDKRHDVDSKQVALELLQVCGENPLLNKISVSKLFINLNRSNKLEAYLKTKSRKVVLDTQVLFQLICANYKNVPYDNLWYKSVMELNKIWNSSSSKDVLITTDGYIKEVSNHLIEAYRIDNFLGGFNDSSIGVSNNVFYSYYLFLQKNGYVDFDSFSDFIDDLLGVNPDEYNDEFALKNLLNRNIQEILDHVDVSVVSMIDYSDEFKPKLKRAYEEELIATRKNKSYYALLNDVDAIVYLSTPSNHLDSGGQISEPFFVTWDSSLQSVRGLVDKISSSSNYWYLYSPAKLLDRLSVMKFSLNPKSVTSNIIALAEYNFNNSSKISSSFVDLLQSLSGNKKLSAWSLGKELTQMRKQQQSSGLFEEDNSPYKNLPIDVIVLEILKHYRSGKAEHSFTDLVATFGNLTVKNVVFDIVKKYASLYKPGASASNGLFDEIDAVITSLKDGGKTIV